MTITFDTLKLAQKLESSGFSREQATGAAEDLSENLSMEKGDLVTKTDLKPLETDIAIMKAELGMIKWMMGGTVFGIFLLVVKTFLV